MDSQHHIVIIGGGAAGAAVVKDLLSRLNPLTHILTIINPRPYFVHLPALIRTAVTSEGGLEELMLMPYSDEFLTAPKPHPSGSGTFRAALKIGEAVRFTTDESGGEVELGDGERVRYNSLVLAMGSSWTGPLNLPSNGDFAAAKAHVDSWRTKFEKAKNVVLVGGGAVGVEFAGEIRDFYPVRFSISFVSSLDRHSHSCSLDLEHQRHDRSLAEPTLHICIS